MADATMQPHMMPQCAAPRNMPRRKMKRLAPTSTTALRASTATFCARKRGAKKACHPRRQYILVGGRCSHIAYR
jgi:hypothetical protein